MAAPSKKRAVPEEMENVVEELPDSDQEDDEDDSEEEEMEGQEFVNQEINVEFEARNMEDPDFHGIRKLLSQLYLKANIDLSELTNTLISQNYIGSVIKQVPLDEEDEDTGMNVDEDDDIQQVFGVISVVNLTERKKLKCVKELKSTLIDRCSKCAKKDELAAIFNDESKSLGMIINERFINIPAQIAVPSFESLWNEVSRASDKKMPYAFSHYVIVCKACTMDMKGPKGYQTLRTYINNEEEFFAQEAIIQCEYSVKSERDSVTQGQWTEDDDEMEPTRVVMVIPADRVPVVMGRIKEAFGTS